MSRERYVAVRSHRPESAEVLDVACGEGLKFERRETVYPGWIWCTDAGGCQAWVPEAYVSIEGDGCRMLRDYVSRELTIEAGEIVEMIDTTSGWAWIRMREGKQGWVPLQCLERSSEDADSQL